MIFIREDDGRRRHRGRGLRDPRPPARHGAQADPPQCVTTRRAAPRSGSPPRAAWAGCSPRRSASPTIRTAWRSARRRSRAWSTAAHGERAAAIARMPGLRTWIVYMQVRTRVIDDAARAFVARRRPPGRRCSARATTAARCGSAELAGARVFEVDHPATQGHKRAVLERLGVDLAGALPRRGTSRPAPMDDLPGALAEAGHDPARADADDLGGRHDVPDRGRDRRLAARDRDLERARLRARDDATSRSRATTSCRSRPAWCRPWSSGSASRSSHAGRPSELPDYLEARGFDLVRDVSTAAAARELLPADLAAQATRDNSRVAFARPSAGVS